MKFIPTNDISSIKFYHLSISDGLVPVNLLHFLLSSFIFRFHRSSTSKLPTFSRSHLINLHLSSFDWTSTSKPPTFHSIFAHLSISDGLVPVNLLNSFISCSSTGLVPVNLLHLLDSNQFSPIIHRISCYHASSFDFNWTSTSKVFSFHDVYSIIILISYYYIQFEA